MNLYIVGGFILVLLIIAYVMRNARYGKLVFAPGETILFEEEGIKVHELFRGSERIKSYFRNVYVVVTTKRIIFSLKPWLISNKKKYPLHSVVNYVETGPALDIMDMFGGFLFKGGYPTFYTTAERITATIYKNKPVLEITIPFKNHGPLLAEPKIRLFTTQPAHYVSLLQASIKK